MVCTVIYMVSSFDSQDTSCNNWATTEWQQASAWFIAKPGVEKIWSYDTHLAGVGISTQKSAENSNDPKKMPKGPHPQSLILGAMLNQCCIGKSIGLPWEQLFIFWKTSSGHLPPPPLPPSHALPRWLRGSESRILGFSFLVRQPHHFNTFSTNLLGGLDQCELSLSLTYLKSYKNSPVKSARFTLIQVYSLQTAINQTLTYQNSS